MWSFLIGEFGPWLIGAGGVLLGVVLAYFRGRGDGKKLERSKITEGQVKLHEAYNETNARPLDRDSAYDELRRRASRNR